MKKSTIEYPDELNDHRTDVGVEIRKNYEQAEKDRAETEQRWLEDLRQYKGQYASGTFDEDYEGSKIFVRETRKKVKTIAANLRDILFPTGKARNWDMRPTKKPVLHPRDIQDVAMVMKAAAAAGEDFDPDKLVMEIATERCNAMRDEVEDQLTEAHYSEIAGGEVITSGVKYGTGILKGPMVEEKVIGKWKIGEEGDWQQIEEKEQRPYVEAVQVWDIYPDMDATDVKRLRHISQRHKMLKADVLGLAKREDFKAAVIKDYLRSVPKGDYDKKSFQASLDEIGESGSQSVGTTSGYYEVIEYWGEIDAKDLRECSCDDVNDDDVGSYWANVWLLGPFVIKVELSPFTGEGKHPYHFFYFDKDETSIFGDGVPALLRDDQEMLNASTRAMLDNAAITAGPMVEVNLDLLDPAEDPRDIRPFRTFLRRGHGAAAQFPAIRDIRVASNVAEYAGLISLAERWGSEHTVPAYMYGQNDPRGAAGTASGLSMLMSAANVEIKDLAKNFDTGITKPFLSEMYSWNMEMGKDNIKGDYKVIPQGASSLVAKELRANQLDQFAASVNNDLDAKYVDRHELLLRRAEAHEVGEGIVRSKEEVEKQMQEAAKKPDPARELAIADAKAEIEKKEADAQQSREKAKSEEATRLREQIEIALDAGDTDAALALWGELKNANIEEDNQETGNPGGTGYQDAAGIQGIGNGTSNQGGAGIQN